MGICELQKKEMVNEYHYPVMYREVLEFLKPKESRIVIDCTFGMGSHAYKMLETMKADAHLVGIDKDQNSLDIAAIKLEPFKGRFTLVKDNFIHLDKILEELNIEKADIFLFDLGISTYQLNDAERGFSFQKEGPLDMRMDQDSFLSAYDLINNLSENELENIFRKFGEERYSRRIAHLIMLQRKNNPISTTAQLAEVIVKAVPLKNRYDRIHPATRVFQSLRIAVNRELEALQVGLIKALSLLGKDARIGVISFHSLEDRVVKHIFRDYAHRGLLKLITKKPVVASETEKEENPASRSAKLRVAQRV